MEGIDKEALAGAISAAILKALNDVIPAENVPEFHPGDVPVSLVAEIYGKDSSWVRARIIAGWLPIGRATRNGELVTDISQMDSRQGRISYHISPKKLWEDTGYIWKGEKSYAGRERS